MGDAVRGPDANRYGMWGQGRMGTACRGDPTGRPYAMGNARNGRRGAVAPTRTGTVCGDRAEWARHAVPLRVGCAVRQDQCESAAFAEASAVGGDVSAHCPRKMAGDSETNPATAAGA